MKDSGNMAGNE